MDLPLLPTINASLNGLAGVFLLLGYGAIRRRNIGLHRKYMVAAFITSGLFLCCYLYYHFTTHLVTKYPGTGLLKALYLAILIPHSILAALIVPFILMALYYAFKGQFDKHTRITRKLFPAWVYVSVTGVLVYLMLYVFRPA